MNNLSNIYKEIEKEYDLIRSKNQAIIMSRRQEINIKIPEYKQIDDKIADLSFETAKLRIFDPNANIDSYQEEIQKLATQKKLLLQSAGFPDNYLDNIYNCEKCHDTGYISGAKCQCLNLRLIEARYEQSHIKEVLKHENFSSFSYEYYTEEEAARVSNAVKASKYLIEHFDDEYKNLLFFGEVGTGKTFLSNCIAKELLDKGKSVLYFTAPGIFEMISSTFKKNSEIDSDSFYEDIFNCDLLILDDLGTESYNSFTVGQFFIILNERLTRRKSTVISTNMDIQRLKDLYSERSISRILGGYDMFLFKGQDLRVTKKIKSKN